MPEQAVNQDGLTNKEEQRRLEVAYAEQRQHSRLSQLRQQTKQAAKQAVTSMAKKQVKKVIWRWIWQGLIVILFNPWTWVILAAVLILVLAYACAQDITACISEVGLDELIKLIS
ncbi:MAG: hypothetical protein ABIJ81_02125 [Patescibacteria group bacterium]